MSPNLSRRSDKTITPCQPSTDITKSSVSLIQAEERQRETAEKEAARRAASAAKRAADKQQAAGEAKKREAITKDESLCWKCAQAGAFTFAVLVLYSWIDGGIRHTAHEISLDWENSQSQFKPKKQTQQPELQPTIQPDIPPYERYPGSS